MKKFVYIAASVVVLGIVGVIAFVLLNAGGIIKTAVEEIGPRLTQSEVKLGSADVSLTSGSGELKGFYLGNPDGFESSDAFKVGLIRVTVDTSSVTTDTIVLKEVVVLAPEITYEKKGATDNFKTILANVNKAVGASDSQGSGRDSGGEKSESQSKKLIIENFIIRDGKVNVAGGLMQVFGDKGMGIALPNIHLKDIGKKKGGATPAEAMSRIFGAITKGVTGSVSSVAKGLGKALESGTKLLQDGASSVGDTLKDGAGSATDAVKGLFN